MKKFVATAGVTICSLIVFELNAHAQDNFQELSGVQIRAKFTGMRFTDEVHWGEVYGLDGLLTSQDMGRKRVGTWRIQRNQLCTDLGQEVGNNCYEVWVSGKNVQLRPTGLGLPLEGILEKPAARN